MSEIGGSLQKNRMKQPSRRSRGFTLIELLTVVTIFAVIAGFTTLAIRKDPHRILDNSAKRFVDQFTLISEEAALLGLDYGLRMDEQSYVFLQWDQLVWRTPQDPYLATVTDIPEQIEAEIILDATTTLELDAEDSSNAGDTVDGVLAEPPQILILSSGEITPFTIEFRAFNSDDSLEVKVDALGRTEVERHNEE